MRLLLTNDDGWDAPGLMAMRGACLRLWPAAEILVVAPADEASQVGHRVTTTAPLRVDERGEGVFAVGGTPADCVRLALSVILPWRPDWVLSGINAGGNLGHDIPISGTVAAAREAAYHGVSSAAFSHFIVRGLPLDWETAALRATLVFRELTEQTLEDGEFWNVNLPHLPPDSPAPRHRLANPERKPLENAYHRPGSDNLWHYAGRYHERPHGPESDVAVCFGGDISVSRLRV